MSEASGPESAYIFYKIAAGGDAAPVIGNSSNAYVAQLAEFSGNAVVTPLDKTGTTSGTTNSGSMTMGGTEAAVGELILVALVDYRGDTVGTTITISLNNAAYVGATFAFDNKITVGNFGYGFGTANSSDTAATIAMGTTTNNFWAAAMASFKLGPPANNGNMLTVMGA